MNQNELKQKYTELEPIQTIDFNDSWVNKVIPFENFMSNGQATADTFRRLKSFNMTESYDRARNLNPQLFDLVLSAF